MTWVLLTGLALAAGAVGTIVPVIPGLVLSWAAVVVFAFAAGWSFGALVVVALSTLLLGVGTVAGIRMPQRAAALVGLTRSDQLLAFAAGVVGFFVIPVVGLPIGFAIGVFLTRFQATNDVASALAATRVTMIAVLKSTGVQFLCALGIGVVWFAWVVAGARPR